MTNVIKLDKNKRFPKELELSIRLGKLVHEYDEELSLVAVLGILELAKNSIISDCEDGSYEE